MCTWRIKDFSRENRMPKKFPHNFRRRKDVLSEFKKCLFDLFEVLKAVLRVFVQKMH